MRKWLPAILILGIVAVTSVYLLTRLRVASNERMSSPASNSRATVPAPDKVTVTGTQTSNAVSNPVSDDSPLPVNSASPPSASATALPDSAVREEELPRLPPYTVLENTRAVFRQYQSRFGGNPVGTNPEITRALNGENPRQIRFLRMEDGMRINARGELVDTWGTPYFFHQLSGAEMEIHSAGPDKVMWTADDLVIK